MENALEIYSGVSILGYVLAAIFLITSVAIFFLMNIRGVYSYLSGKKQQKGILEMREKQTEGENIAVPVSAKMPSAPPTKHEVKTPSEVTSQPVSDEKKNVEATKPADTGSETVNLQRKDIVSNSDATDILGASANADTEEYPTDVLNKPDLNSGGFTIIKNVMEIHTSEVL